MTRNWKAVAAAGALILVLDPILMLPTWLDHTYSSDVASGGTEAFWLPNAAALLVAAVVLARSRLPIVHAWTCVAWMGVDALANLSSSGYLGTSLPLAGVPIEWLDVAIFAALVLRFPRARLAPSHRVWVAAVAVLLPAAQLLEWWAADPVVYLTNSPVGWHQLPVPDVVYRHVIYPVAELLAVAASVGTCVLLARRYRSSRGPTRGALLTLLGGATFSAVLTAANLPWIPAIAWHANWGFYDSWSFWSSVANFSAAFVPGIMAVALLAALLRYRTAAGNAAVRILGGDLTGALPSATLPPAGAPPPAPGRLRLTVPGAAGTALEVDAAEVDTFYVEGLLDVVRMALENDRLRAEQLRYADRVLESRARAVEAAMAERHRLERDLHDGVQQAMLGLSALLSRAELAAASAAAPPTATASPAPATIAASTPPPAPASTPPPATPLPTASPPASPPPATPPPTASPPASPPPAPAPPATAAATTPAAATPAAAAASRADLVAEAEALAGAILRDVDRLCEGLRPSALERAGLASALPTLASTAALQVRLDIGEPGQMPPTVESVTYYVVAEALANAVKHAAATRATVSLDRSGEALTVSIEDDGIGGAELVPGGGLAGLADRVAMAGGRLEVGARAEGGTRVRAVLPCPV